MREIRPSGLMQGRELLGGGPLVSSCLLYIELLFRSLHESCPPCSWLIFDVRQNQIKTMNIAPSFVLVIALAIPPAILEAMYLGTKRRAPKLGAIALFAWMPFSLCFAVWFAISLPRAIGSGATIIEAAPIVLIAVLNLALVIVLFRKASRLWRSPAPVSAS